MHKYIGAALAMAMIALFSFPAKAQTAYDSYSPYSMYGIGFLEKQGNQNSFAMGGIGIGDRENSTINLLNPAAVTEREQKAFMLDFGLTNKNTYYTAAPLATKTDNTTSANNLVNIHHIAISFPIYKSSAFKLGIMPYSSSGYNLLSHENDDNIVANIGDVQYTQTGKGGVYQTFAGAGVTFWDRLSIGADAIFYIGTMDRYSTAYFSTASAYRNITRGSDYVIRGWGGKAGIQYSQPLGKDYKLTLGATYKLPSKLNTERTYTAYAKGSDTDTLASQITNFTYDIPSEIGVGFTIRKKDKWMAGFDYTRSDWSKTSFEATPGIDFAGTVAQNFNAGFEFTPNKYDIRYYMKRVTYRMGAYHNKSYMMLAGEQINATGFTLGLSFPVFNRHTALSVALDLGQTGTLANNLIRERYVKINVGLNLFDIWFQKSLYN
ncbi:MAG: hypothetical protein HUJ93_01250 [Bacteroidales bacterium]|nr:hypothetical protein [Bacteroidales bacterium]